MIGIVAEIQFIIEWLGIANKKVEKISAWFLVTPAIACAFAWLLAPIGFPLTASCAMAALFYIFGERQPGIIIGVTGVVVIGIHVIFIYFLLGEKVSEAPFFRIVVDVVLIILILNRYTTSGYNHL